MQLSFKCYSQNENAVVCMVVWYVDCGVGYDCFGNGENVVVKVVVVFAE